MILVRADVVEYSNTRTIFRDILEIVTLACNPKSATRSGSWKIILRKFPTSELKILQIFAKKRRFFKFCWQKNQWSFKIWPELMIFQNSPPKMKTFQNLAKKDDFFFKIRSQNWWWWFAEILLLLIFQMLSPWLMRRKSWYFWDPCNLGMGSSNISATFVENVRLIRATWRNTCWSCTQGLPIDLVLFAPKYFATNITLDITSRFVPLIRRSLPNAKLEVTHFKTIINIVPTTEKSTLKKKDYIFI